MSSERDALVKQAQLLKGKSKKARGEGKRDQAKAFRKGAQRLARKLKTMPKPAAAKGEAAAAAPAAG